MPPVPPDNDPASSSGFQATVPEPHRSRGYPLDAAAASHWLSTEAAFAGTGGLVNADELAELIRRQCALESLLAASPPASLVARWISFRKVVLVDSPWGPMLPLFQFDLPRATVHIGVQLVLGELKGVLSDVELALWFVTPNEWLAGLRPIQIVTTRVAAVQRAARTDRYVALGG